MAVWRTVLVIFSAATLVYLNILCHSDSVFSRESDSRTANVCLSEIKLLGNIVCLGFCSKLSKLFIVFFQKDSDIMYFWLNLTLIVLAIEYFNVCLGKLYKYWILSITSQLSFYPTTYYYIPSNVWPLMSSQSMSNCQTFKFSSITEFYAFDHI